MKALLLIAVAASLAEDTAFRVLEKSFDDGDVSYLVVDARSGALMACRGFEPNQPIPLGSLMKPFAALAWGAAHGFRYPEYYCRGEQDGCWLPRGHGRVGLREAIAHSCNAYFRRLATEDVSRCAARFGLSPPEESAPPEARIGLGAGWKVAPVSLARAYAELAARAGEPGFGEILAGLALAAREGTGSVIGSRALAKTGTAPCSSPRPDAGDGFVMVLYPAERPERP